MSRASLAIMNIKLFARIKNKLGSVICHLCNNPMIVNDYYIAIKSAKCSRAKSYHVSCAEKVNITYDSNRNY